MSLMAGFDLVTEISNETIRKLLENNLQIGGAPISPPSDLSLPISSSAASGIAHLVVTDMQVDLNADDTITLILSFDRASVVTTAPVPLTVCTLDGNITITAPLQLVDAYGSNKQVSVNLAAATVAINWSSAASQAIINDLAGTPITPDMFMTFVALALTGYVQSVAAPTMPLAFSVVPGSDGLLTPSLQFERLEVHCIHNTNRSLQALGIFGILLVANDGNGDYRQKTTTAIAAIHDGVCVSIAPGAFHTLVFCPAVAGSLGADDVAKLPGSCGQAHSFKTQGVNIKNIADSFADGHIDINGSVSKSGTCYDASGTFHGTLTLSIAGSTVTPNVVMDEPDIDVSIPWYCWLAAAVVLGPIGVVLAGVVDVVADSIASGFAGDAMKNALGGAIPGISIGALSDATFNSVAISTEGICMQGTALVVVSHQFVTPSLRLSGSVITTQKQEVASGTVHFRLWCMGQAKDYPYVEYSQHQRAVYQLIGTLVSQPLTPYFEITTNVGATRIPLAGGSGTIELPNVSTHYPMPLATGGTGMQQNVNIGYSISGTNIQLTNVPSEGDYSFWLRATATDCNGNPVQDDSQQELATWIQVQFEGDHVDIGGDWADDVQKCAEALKNLLNKWRHGLYRYPTIPVFPPVDYPPPETLITYIRDVVALDVPQSDEILVASKITHGNSFYRAIFSPAARQPGLLKARAKLAIR